MTHRERGTKVQLQSPNRPPRARNDAVRSSLGTLVEKELFLTLTTTLFVVPAMLNPAKHIASGCSWLNADCFPPDTSGLLRAPQRPSELLPCDDLLFLLLSYSRALD